MGRYDILLKRKIKKNLSKYTEMAKPLDQQVIESGSINSGIVNLIQQQIDVNRLHQTIIAQNIPVIEENPPDDSFNLNDRVTIRSDSTNVETLDVTGNVLINGDLSRRVPPVNRPGIIINSVYSRNFFKRILQKIKYSVSELFRGRRIKIVWSDHMSVEDVNILRSDIETALLYPNHIIVSNFEIHVQDFKV